MAKRNNDGSIVLNTRVDTSGFTQGVNTMKSGINSLTTSVKQLAGALGLGFGIYQLINFGKESMKLASDLQEVQNVVDVSFGDMSHKMENFANTSLKTYGISRLTAKEIGSSFMAMANSIGIASDEASDMSIQLTALAADMASFYNVSTSEAQTALSAIFTGETEALKRYGIMIHEANLEQFALANGIEKSVSAMSQQEKVMLRYYYVLSMTTQVQGDFSRTSDSFANKSRVLAEQWKEMQIVFGETLIILADALMPLIQTVIKGLTIAMLYLAAFVKGMQGISPSAEKTKDAVSDAGNAFGKMAAQISNNISQSKTNTNAIKTETSAIKNLGNATKQTTKQLAQFDDLIMLQTAGSNKIDIGFNTPDFSGVLEGLESFKIDMSNFDKQLSSLEDFVGSDTWKNIEEFQQWVNDNKEGIKLALEGSLFISTAVGVARLVSWIYNLVKAFKKKDRGLDTQRGKLETETELVNALVPAFSLASVGAYDFGLACDNFAELLEKRDSQLVTAAERIGEMTLQMIAGKDKATEFSTELEGVTSNADSLAPAFNSATESVYGTNGALVETGAVADQVGQKIQGLQSDIEKLSPAFNDAKTAAENAVTNISTAIESLKVNVETNSEALRSKVEGDSSALETNVTENVGTLAEGASGSFADWLTNVSTNVAKYASNVSQGFYDLYTNVYENICTFVEGAVPAYADWAKATMDSAEGVAKATAMVASVMANTRYASVQTPLGATLDLIDDTLLSAIGLFFGNQAKKIEGYQNFSYHAKNLDWSGALSLGGLLFSGLSGIPALAKGGVIPPNREFLAVLGDQKQGLNIEAPLQTIVDAFNLALSNNGGGSTGNTTVILEIDGREFGHAVIEQGKRESRRLGTRMVMA